MVTIPKRIHLEGAIGSDLEAILDDANDSPLRIERDGMFYRVSRANNEGNEEMRAGYDPERARRVLEETAGSWSDIDADQMIADLYAAREQGTRPPDRP